MGNLPIDTSSILLVARLPVGACFRVGRLDEPVKIETYKLMIKYTRVLYRHLGKGMAIDLPVLCLR